ncbi:MAG: hypothetical protein ACFFAN_05660 [Promethearchaeota archaeon]
MESLQTISKIEIAINKILYDKSSKIFSVEIFGFNFVGHYKKSVNINTILNDIYASLGDTKLQRNDICILGANNLPISEKTKLKDLNLKKRQKKFNIKEIQIQRGGDWNAEETQFDFKVKIQNDSSFIIENVQIVLTSIPQSFEVDHDKYKIDILKPNSFKSHTFLLKSESYLISDVIEAKVIFTDPMGNQQTKDIAPLQIPSRVHYIAPEKKSKMLSEMKRRLVTDKEDMTREEKEEEKAFFDRRRDKDKKAKKKEKILFTDEEEIIEDRAFDDREPPKEDLFYLEKSKAEEETEPAVTSSDISPAAPGGGPKEPALASPKPVSKPELKPKPTTYNIKMGFQYYTVMMEQKSYLFYVYFSHEELKILDEEGKTIYKTTFTITTFKKEPPVLDLKIEGKGFDIHPLTGKIIVKKDAVNPPVMIFSIMPLKTTKKKKRGKKKSERRYLNVYIEFENQIINHTILSVIIQPKHFHLDLGPIQIDISKRTAFLVSFISALAATISTLYSAITLETTSLVDILSGFAPGLASFIFFAVFIITLIKNGIYPLKEKWSALLNFDKGIGIMK